MYSRAGFIVSLTLSVSLAAPAQQTPLVSSTHGNLRSVAIAVLNPETGSDVLEKWSRDLRSSGLPLSGFSPFQLDELKQFVADVATYKNLLGGSYSLLSREEGDAYYAAAGTNRRVVFDQADAYYRANVIARHADIWASDNYRSYYNGAMLAKVGAAAALGQVMTRDGSYSGAAIRAVIDYAINNARHIFEGSPSQFIEPEDQTLMATRDKVVAELRQRRSLLH